MTRALVTVQPMPDMIQVPLVHGQPIDQRWVQWFKSLDMLLRGAAIPQVGVDALAYDSHLFSNIPVVSYSANHTVDASEAQKCLLHPSSDNNPRTFTIDSNANVPHAIGTAITFANRANTLSIAITSDTLILAGTSTTGTRSLAANGLATALKVESTVWIISGPGLS